MQRAFRVFFVAVFLLCSVGAGVSSAADPAFGNWSWPLALAKINSMSSTIGSSCRSWVETYGTSGYRLWKRCGVNTTLSGARVKDFSLPAAITGQTNNINFSVQSHLVSVNGDGTVTPGPSLFLPINTPTGFSSSWGVQLENNKLAKFAPAPVGRLNDYPLTCIGTPGAGGQVDVLLSADVWHSTSGSYLRDTSVANNTVSSVCTSSDSLLIDFGPIASTCTAGVTVLSTIRGYTSEVGDCDCIPRGQDIGNYYPPNTCSFYSITGDPARMGTSSAAAGSTTDLPGHTFTNDDLARLGGLIPIGGSDAGGGIAPIYGQPGASGNVSPSAGTGGSGSGLGGTTTSSGGSPTGTCTGQNCNDDGSVDSGFIPGLPTYDSTIAGQPVDASPTWVEQVLNFMSSSPIVGVITGSGLTASGSCALTASVYNATIDFGFCNIPSSFYSTMGPLLLLVSHLVAFFIIFR